MAQATTPTTPTTRRPDRARRSVLDRLLGTSGAERLERYTRMSALSLFLLLPAIGVAVAAYVIDTDRPADPVLGAFWGMGMLAACVLGAMTFGPALRNYVEDTPPRRRQWLPLVVLCGALVALAFAFPLVQERGFGSPGLVALVSVLPAACALAPALPPRWTGVVVLGTTALAVLVDAVSGAGLPDLVPVALAALFWAGVFVPTMRLSAWMTRVVRELEQARATAARLAVAEERLRFSRDLHDVVGRSLSTISLKTELATALLQRDRTDQATAELAAVRDLAADALTEMRAVVAGYRRADLSAELAGARAVLDAAGVRTTLLGPVALVESLGAGVQEALAWVVREGTTNVVRHSAATRCALAFEVAERDVLLTLTNDGVGAGRTTSDALTHHHGGGGNGLVGLGERLSALGGSLGYGAEKDTFVLRARVPRTPDAPAPAAATPSPTSTGSPRPVSVPTPIEAP